MEERSNNKKKKKSTVLWLCDELLERILALIADPCDRAAVSEVNRQWYRVEARTRSRLVVKCSYAVHPWRLAQRFTGLASVTIKGRPRIYDWGLLGDDWGGAADTWIRVLVACCPSLAAIHLRRFDVPDSAIAAIATAAFASSLQVLKLDRCSGFSTRGLLEIARHCKNLRVLSLDESIVDGGGEQWLRALADTATKLEVLSFSLTGIEVRGLDDVAAIVSRNKRLASLRLDEVRTTNDAISRARGILRDAASLQEMLLLYRSVDESSIIEKLELPKTVTSLAGDISIPLDCGLASRLLKLDLMLTTLDSSQLSLLHQTFQACPNLEELKVRNSIGDEGVEAIAKHCRKLKRIRIENLEDNHHSVSQRGLITLASSCPHLRTVAIYASDVSNAAFAAFGHCCRDLYDFRIAVLDSPTPLTDTPLDAGVKSLLQGCRGLRKLALYLKRGGLSDHGLAEMGVLAGNLKWLLLGCAGYSDAGFVGLAAGCARLTKLELRHCPFSEAGMAAGVARMERLRYVWSQGYREVDARELLALGPAWNIEYMPSRDAAVTQFVAYRSLLGPRMDCPPRVMQLVG
ncbi:hypothetical protein SELMODRAFT_186055 [Selaginella moellendorffii]|uniref:COI1 F-box domain-containing protein n=2 Tax=Selaginella moellendorffii TaxID=88036 RepID=D8T758_SELML|nr:hypothetical protein SELMODRAFT_186055 [Selaginella moellendorffii]